MYPWLRTGAILLGGRRRVPLAFTDTAVLELRAGPFDVDLFGELNNARHLSMMELGRWDYSARVGFLDLMKARRWGVVVGGASLRYRRRITLFARFELRTRVLCHDGRWFYFLQETWREDRICSSGLIKAGVSERGGGLVDAPRVLEAMGVDDALDTVPDWVGAWIEAEGQRPWPSVPSTSDGDGT